MATDLSLPYGIGKRGVKSRRGGDIISGSEKRLIQPVSEKKIGYTCWRDIETIIVANRKKKKKKIEI